MRNRLDFTPAKIKELLAPLREDRKPLWGIMTPQHMVEHLTIAVKASSGRIKSKVVTPADQLAAVRLRYLGDDNLWERGMKNPLLPADRLTGLKYGSLEEAKDHLVDAVEEFEEYYRLHPEAKEANPFVGYMDYWEWKQFHFKHFRHHFIQFGLMEDLYADKSRPKPDNLELYH